MKAAKIKRTIVTHIEDKIDVIDFKRDLIFLNLMNRIKNVFELAIDEDEHDYYIENNQLIICILRSRHKELFNGLAIIAKEYVSNCQCINLNHANINDCFMFINDIDSLYLKQ